MHVLEGFFPQNLPSLLILDMYGNPIVSNMTAYRSFVIYHLKSLRALDGTAIESSEVATAKENYGGRLAGTMFFCFFCFCFFDTMLLESPSTACTICIYY